MGTRVPRRAAMPVRVRRAPPPPQPKAHSRLLQSQTMGHHEPATLQHDPPFQIVLSVQVIPPILIGPAEDIDHKAPAVPRGRARELPEADQRQRHPALQ